MNQFVKSTLKNYRTSSLDNKKKDKARKGTNINAQTSPVQLQNPKGKNRATRTVKRLRRNAHRTKGISHGSPMPLSKSVNQIRIIVRKVSKARQRKATTEIEKVNQTERRVERTSNQSNLVRYIAGLSIAGTIQFGNQ